jgi:RsiW-degrading membrane proteinase PrsW (M82 family)
MSKSLGNFFTIKEVLDKFEPEPKFLVLQVFFWGMLITFPIAAIEGILPINEIVLAVIVAPVLRRLGNTLLL